MSAGQRRGAMMGCLRIDHPDIEQVIDAKRDPARLRKVDVPIYIGDPSRFRTALGFAPEIPFDRTLDDILSAARAAT